MPIVYIVGLHQVQVLHISMDKHFLFSNKGGKFLNKMWCCVGGKYDKIIWFYQLGS